MPLSVLTIGETKFDINNLDSLMAFLFDYFIPRLLPQFACGGIFGGKARIPGKYPLHESSIDYHNSNLFLELNGIDVVFPVTWLSFTGGPQADDVLLNWATVTKENTREFIVERSLDGRQFTAAGTVRASRQSSNYEYLDADAMQLETKMLFYRLKQVDLDGKYVYSAIVVAPVTKTSIEAIVNTYPNPFTRQLSLKIVTVTPTDQTDKVELYTLDGRLVYQRRLAQRGSATILLQDLPDLNPGIYTLHAVIAKNYIQSNPYGGKFKHQLCERVFLVNQT